MSVLLMFVELFFFQQKKSMSERLNDEGAAALPFLKPFECCKYYIWMEIDLKWN